MRNSIVVAASVMLLGTLAPAVQAEECSADVKLNHVTQQIDVERKNGKLSAKQAAGLKTEATKLSNQISDSKTKNKGALSDGDSVKYCNRIKALDEKVSRASNPGATKDAKALAAVRKAIMGHKGFSTDAQNVKLSFEDGNLVLDGNVKSETEKEALINCAKSATSCTVATKLTVVQ